jgi:hypothetical protein
VEGVHKAVWWLSHPFSRVHGAAVSCAGMPRAPPSVSCLRYWRSPPFDRVTKDCQRAAWQRSRDVHDAEELSGVQDLAPVVEWRAHGMQLGTAHSLSTWLTRPKTLVSGWARHLT